MAKLLLFVENMILYINIINATNSIFDGFRITVHGWCQNWRKNVTLLKYVLKQGNRSVEIRSRCKILGCFFLSATTFKFWAAPSTLFIAAISFPSPVKSTVISPKSFNIHVWNYSVVSFAGDISKFSSLHFSASGWVSSLYVSSWIELTASVSSSSSLRTLVRLRASSRSTSPRQPPYTFKELFGCKMNRFNRTFGVWLFFWTDAAAIFIDHWSYFNGILNRAKTIFFVLFFMSTTDG